MSLMIINPVTNCACDNGISVLNNHGVDEKVDPTLELYKMEMIFSEGQWAANIGLKFQLVPNLKMNGTFIPFHNDFQQNK